MSWFYIRHVLGFAIQFLCPMALCFVPWDKGSYRHDRKWALIWFGIGGALLSLAFPLPLMFTDVADLLLGDLYMLVAIVIFCIAFFCEIREHVYQKVMVVILAVLYAFVQYTLVNFVVMFFLFELEGVYAALHVWGFALSAAVLMPFSVLLFRRAVGVYLRKGDGQFVPREFWRLLIVTVAYFAVVISLNVGFDLMDGEGNLWLCLVPLFLFSACLLVMFYWQLLRDSVKRKEEYEKQRAEELNRIQYSHIMRDIESARRMRHDMRHHLNMLRGLAEEGSYAALQQYIDEMIDRSAVPESVWYCDNITINGLLRDYIGRAREQGIDCVVTANVAELPISPVDLTVILGNALENAVRAATASEEKWLRVELGVVGGSLAIQIENSSPSVHFAHAVDGARFLPADAFLSDRLGGGLGLSRLPLPPSAMRAARSFVTTRAKGRLSPA